MGLSLRNAAILCAFAFAANSRGGTPSYTVEQAVTLARRQNPDIAIARKQLEAAQGSLIEAKAGFLPSLISSGLARKREHQSDSRLRDSDYNASLRVVENLYTGGAVSNQMAIARLNLEKQALELQQVTDRVSMDVRVAFYELLLNRAKISVRQESVGVLQQELKTQQERLGAGTVGSLNVRRAEVALANEQPELIDAQTRLQNSQLRLAELFGMDSRADDRTIAFQVAGRLQYQSHPAQLNECLAYADVNRPEIRMREIDVRIQEHQMEIERSELRPRVEVFSGYEVYNERDPDVGRELNHGYVVGVNASWHLFDGFATKGRVQVAKARRDAAIEALRAARNSVASDVRSAFLDLDQADRILQSETRNVQSADESLEIAKGNLNAGLGTQLDILQAASDVSRTRTTRLGAIYLHNVALARIARASARDPDALGFAANVGDGTARQSEEQILQMTKPPASLAGPR